MDSMQRSPLKEQVDEILQEPVQDTEDRALWRDDLSFLLADLVRAPMAVYRAGKHYLSSVGRGIYQGIKTITRVFFGDLRPVRRKGKSSLGENIVSGTIGSMAVYTGLGAIVGGMLGDAGTGAITGLFVGEGMTFARLFYSTRPSYREKHGRAFAGDPLVSMLYIPRRIGEEVSDYLGSLRERSLAKRSGKVDLS